MCQTYHKNAVTMEWHRKAMQWSNKTNECLAQKFGTSTQTVSKWRNRNYTADTSSRPHTINYAINALQTAIIITVRKATWMPLDELLEILLPAFPNIKRIALYRCLRRQKIEKMPPEKRINAKKFKEYRPGFLHIDVTYLPKLNGKNAYHFVAIDRATRIIYYRIYQHKTAKNAADFLSRCKHFFPCIIETVLTDNGLEFTNAYLKNKKQEKCKKMSLFDKKCRKYAVEHRLTPPFSPKTNGMVERANGIIKNATVINTKYNNLQAMDADLTEFLIYYNLNRRHGSLRKELNVRTPYEALCKWQKIEPSLFTKTPEQVKNTLMTLTSVLDAAYS